MHALRFILFAGGASIYAVSRLVGPVYRARPEILLDSVSVLIPPGAARAAASGALIFIAVWLFESLLYRVVLRLPLKLALAESLRSYTPLAMLFAYALLFFPGLPGAPMAGWWLLLDASPWILTLVGAATIYRKGSFVLAHVGGLPPLRELSRASLAPIIFATALLAVLIALTPTRRFSEPYDERWGTGDEPRYVRIAASLLHDGDANIANAAENIGRRADPFRFASQVTGWIGSTLATIRDVGSSFIGRPTGEASRLGGQVIRGRNGGTYYVYLPGFPLLVVPAMALDSIFFPGMLPLVLLSCLLLGILTAIATARLVEPYLESRLDSYLVIAGVSLATPVFFYTFQIYPEMTAALCLALMLKVLLARNRDRGGAIVFGLAAALLPWLHTRYYPLLGVCILAFAHRAWRGRVSWKTSLWAIGVPAIAVGLQCLYVFHITGSLLPDTLWVLNGYPRGGYLFNRQALSGLYYLLLGREEGLLVYSPLHLLAIPGVLALWRRSTFAWCLSLAIFVPYLLIAASHDQGGAGGWSPASRYFVPVAPVLVLWLAAWLGRPGSRRARWIAFFMTAAASFWIAQGMLAERNFPYDRIAFLSSGVVNVSGALGSMLEPDSLARRATYPVLLFLVLAFVVLWERRKVEGSFGAMALAVVALLLVVGTTSEAWTARKAWIGARAETGSIQLRPARAALYGLPVCRTGSPRLRFEGAGGEHAVTVSGPGFVKHLRVPPTGPTELEVSVLPFIRIRRGDSQEIEIVRLELEAGQTPLEVQGRCR